MKEFLYVHSLLFSCLLTKKLCLHGSKNPQAFFFTLVAAVPEEVSLLP